MDESNLPFTISRTSCTKPTETGKLVDRTSRRDPEIAGITSDGDLETRHDLAAIVSCDMLNFQK